MKKISYLLISFLIIPLISSCDRDLLETIPTDRLSSAVYWQTQSDAISGANAVYRYLDGIFNLVNYDGTTDILHHNIQFADLATIERGEASSLYPFFHSEWISHYNGIRAANNFLENVDRAEFINPDLPSRLKSEVRVIRAYLYIKLVMLYGDVPFLTETINLEEARTITRTSTSVIWDFINSELAESADLLPLVQAEKGRITKGAALALKARALIYQGEFSRAAAAANSVISLDIYSLYPKYEELFDYPAQNSSEVILDKQHVKDVYSSSAFNLGPYSHRTAGSAKVPTKALVDAYQMNNGMNITDTESGFDKDNPYENRDPRLKYSVFVKGSQLHNGEIYDPTPGSGTQDEIGATYLATSLGYNIKKYVNEQDFPDPTNCDINIILIRYAEVLLTYAEAKIELNEIDQSVYDAINAIRSRTDVDLPIIEAGKTQSQMREIVRHERKIELAFEGHRLFDIRRWRIPEDVIPGYVYGITYQNPEGEYITVVIDGFLKLFNPDKDYLWPIPQRERDLNPNLVQNPGW